MLCETFGKVHEQEPGVDLFKAKKIFPRRGTAGFLITPSLRKTQWFLKMPLSETVPLFAALP